jgi:hypothetical protein
MVETRPRHRVRWGKHMKTTIRALIAVVLLGTGSHALAQAAPTGCPSLPADSGLTWEYKAAASTQFCRALRADGSEAFGLYIAKDSPFKPGRGNRAEQANIEGRTVQWYRSELADKPGVQARETLIELPDGRVAYLWIHAKSQDELGEAIARTTALRFSDARVAGN